jgi:hypothetical protein
MLNNKVILFIIIFVIFLFGFICGGLLSNWDIIKCTFFEVKITELVQIILTLIIAIFITSFVTTRTSNKIRRRDMVLDLVSKLHNCIDKIYEIGCNFLEKPIDEDKSNILGRFRDAGNTLHIIEKIQNTKNIKELEGFNVSIIKELFFQFKKELTDSPFRKDIHVGTVISFNMLYTELSEKLYEYKIKTCL